MITDVEVGADTAGFPIVRWIERRGFMSPAGHGDFRIECRITKDGASGTLHFTVRGHMRNRAFEAGLPWQELQSFGFTPAVHRYLTAAERHGRDEVMKRSKGLAGHLGNGGEALFAQFAGRPLFDISCPETTVIQQDRLQLALQEQFLDPQRDVLAGKLCRQFYRWPLDDDRVETFNPERMGWDGERPVPRWLDISAWLAVAAIFTIGGAVAAWLLGAF